LETKTATAHGKTAFTVATVMFSNGSTAYALTVLYQPWRTIIRKTLSVLL
jgi:hypothetical protein